MEEVRDNMWYVCVRSMIVMNFQIQLIKKVICMALTLKTLLHRQVAVKHSSGLFF